jgi:hypothetical protein
MSREVLNDDQFAEPGCIHCGADVGYTGDRERYAAKATGTKYASWASKLCATCFDREMKEIRAR